MVACSASWPSGSIQNLVATSRSPDSSEGRRARIAGVALALRLPWVCLATRVEDSTLGHRSQADSVLFVVHVLGLRLLLHCRQELAAELLVKALLRLGLRRKRI